jgi:hypothetical protein
MPEVKEPETVMDLSELRELVSSLKSASINSDSTAKKLVEVIGDNFKLRRKLAEVSKASVIDKDAIVLKGDDAKNWIKYGELGDPKSLKKIIEDSKGSVAALAKIERKELYTKAAKSIGMVPEAFTKLAESEGLVIGFSEVKGKNGKTVESAHARGEGDETTPLEEYVKSAWGEEVVERLRSDATPLVPRRGGSPPSTALPPAPKAAQGTDEEFRRDFSKHMNGY